MSWWRRAWRRIQRLRYLGALRVRWSDVPERSEQLNVVSIFSKELLDDLAQQNDREKEWLIERTAMASEVNARNAMKRRLRYGS